MSPHPRSGASLFSQEEKNWDVLQQKYLFLLSTLFISFCEYEREVENHMASFHEYFCIRFFHKNLQKTRKKQRRLILPEIISQSAKETQRNH